jgi:5-formyltetrahydrofolate cyclo-ligase
VSAASRDVAQKVPSVTQWQRVKTVHIYRSLASLGEVDTQPIIDWLARAQPHVAVTVGTSAPEAPFPEGDFEVIFVPVLGFDRGRFRLGMGGGWYDRWLATQPRAYKIGLAYAWAEVENLPHEPHDIPLNQILVD